MQASQFSHVEAMRVLIEKGALIEAANEVRIHLHATTHARSQSLIYLRMHALTCEPHTLVSSNPARSNLI